MPHVLAGRDLFGCAQTGTGKTAAFALPLIERMLANPQQPGPRRCRVLVLAPTRELAGQIYDSFKAYGRNAKIKCAVIYGGVNQRPQGTAMMRGVDVLVATPGRLLDLVNQRLVDLRTVEYLVLDEADRMLDMGFIHDVRRIVADAAQGTPNAVLLGHVAGRSSRVGQLDAARSARSEDDAASHARPKRSINRCSFVPQKQKRHRCSCTC